LPDGSEHVLQGDFTQESGLRAGNQVRRADAPPERRVRGNDTDGDRLPVGAERSRHRVPDDIALAGFD
jgi:DNA-binding LacI/PurR family transcriptional regulator